MKQVIVALVGISGAGKTTFLRRFGFDNRFQHFAAGSIIAAEKPHRAKDRDKFHLGNVDEN